jgi:hypothetical protein
MKQNTILSFFVPLFAFIWPAVASQIEVSYLDPVCNATETPNVRPCNFTTARTDLEKRFPDLYPWDRTTLIDCNECVYSIETLDSAYFWSAELGMHELLNEYGNKTDQFFWAWENLNTTQREQLGYPISEVQSYDGNSYIQCQRGILVPYYAGIWGPVYDKWLQLGGLSTLGAPIRGLQCGTHTGTAGNWSACISTFGQDSTHSGKHKASRIDWIPGQEPRLVTAKFLESSLAWGSYSISDEFTSRDNKTNYMYFLGGSNVTFVMLLTKYSWDDFDKYGREESIVVGKVFEAYQERGGIDGHLGLPLFQTKFTRTVEMMPGQSGTNVSRYQDFNGGSLYCSEPRGKCYETSQKLLKLEKAMEFNKTFNASDAGISGRLKLLIDAEYSNSILLTDFRTASTSQFNYTVACALRDADGQVYAFNKTGYLNGTDATARQQIDGVSAYEALWEEPEYVRRISPYVNKQALVFSDPIECAVKRGLDAIPLREEVIAAVKRNGPSLPSIIRFFEGDGVKLYTDFWELRDFKKSST